MLRGIQKASGSKIGKGIMVLVMGTLVVSFAIWGIGDIFRGFGQSTVAKIGGKEVTIEQFRNYYTDKVSQLGRRTGRQLTSDQIRALGLDRQILGQLVSESALDQKANTMRLGASNEQISRFIASDESFRGLSGQFDRNTFQQMIRQAGYTEASYVNAQRQATVRRQLVLSVSGDIKVPAAMADAVNRFQNERRNVDVMTLTAAQAGDIAKPDAATLTKYFEDRKILFRAPEIRKITLLSLTPTEQARWIAISDADAKATYEQRKSDFGSAEKRELRQIVFPNADDAKAASEKIAKGATFDDIAKERGLKETDTDLGAMTKANIIDPAIAEAAFSLNPGEVTSPVQGRFGTVILALKAIVPSTQQPYEAVADQIKKSLAEQRAKSDIGTLRDKIEDERAGGATLAETAKKLNLTARTIDAIDRSGRDAAGNLIAELPQGADVVGAAFATDVGVETDALQLTNGGLVWIEVNGITPARERSFDEAKDQVETRWRENEVATRLKEKADDMLAKLKNGASLAQFAGENGLTVESAKDLQRGKPTPVLPAKALDAVFKTPKGTAGTEDGGKPDTRIVYVVTDAVVPPADASTQQGKAVVDLLRNGYGEALAQEYVGRIESDIGVTINETALRQVTGGGVNN